MKCYNYCSKLHKWLLIPSADYHPGLQVLQGADGHWAFQCRTQCCCRKERVRQIELLLRNPVRPQRWVRSYATRAETGAAPRGHRPSCIVRLCGDRLWQLGRSSACGLGGSCNQKSDRCQKGSVLFEQKDGHKNRCYESIGECWILQIESLLHRQAGKSEGEFCYDLILENRLCFRKWYKETVILNLAYIDSLCISNKINSYFGIL